MGNSIMRKRYSLSLAGLFLGALFTAVGAAEQANPVILGGVENKTPPPAGRQIFAIRIYNPTGSPVSNVPQQYKQALQTGDLPNGYHLEIRKTDGTTAVKTQQDGCSTWAQDGSCKA